LLQGLISDIESNPNNPRHTYTAGKQGRLVSTVERRDYANHGEDAIHQQDIDTLAD